MITYQTAHSLNDYKYTENAFLSRFAVVPLSQEYNVICLPLVKPGDEVKEGDVIAKYEGSRDEKVFIHSPVPGKIIDIIPSNCPNGHQEYAVKIQMEGKFSYLGHPVEEKTADIIPASVIVEKLIENGVVNTFKINNCVSLGNQIKKMKSSESLVVRLFDEDPDRITDSLTTKFYFDEIVKASQVIAKAVSAKNIVFAMDRDFCNKKELLEKNIPNAHFLEMNIVRYPSGTPREICSAFSRNLRKVKDFSISKKDLFVDSSTMYEVYKAVCLNTPCVSKLVHFSGNCLYASCLLNVKLGTSLKDVVSQLGGFLKDPAQVVVNGSLSGVSVSDLDVPVTKYVKSVSFKSKRSFTDDQIYSCINCGNCRSACPVKISPDILYNNAVYFLDIPEKIEKTSFACIDCGKCNTVCPARLPLCQTISIVRDKLVKKTGALENEK